MSSTFDKIQHLVGSAELRISEHGYDELASDELAAREVVEGVQSAILVEDYPVFPKGPCVLLLQRDRKGKPVHVVWGILQGHEEIRDTRTSRSPAKYGCPGPGSRLRVVGFPILCLRLPCTLR